MGASLFLIKLKIKSRAQARGRAPPRGLARSLARARRRYFAEYVIYIYASAIHLRDLSSTGIFFHPAVLIIQIPREFYTRSKDLQYECGK